MVAPIALYAHGVAIVVVVSINLDHCQIPYSGRCRVVTRYLPAKVSLR